MNKFENNLLVNDESNTEEEEIEEIEGPVFLAGADQELIKKYIEEFLNNHHKINEGNEGIIAVVDSKTFDDKLFEKSLIQDKEKKLALKMMKVYSSPKQAEQEARLQKAAHKIALEWTKNRPEDLLEVSVPEVYFGGQVDLKSEKLIDQLEEEGVAVKNGKVGVILMDYVAGEDFATHLYSEVVKRHEPYEDHHLTELKDLLHIYLDTPIMRDDNKFFSILHSYVQRALHFNFPGGKAKDSKDREFEIRKIENENATKLRYFLAKNNFILDKKILDSLSAFLDTLHKNDIYHRDVHERNIMIENNVDGTKRINIIDFGKAVSGKVEPSEVYKDDNSDKIYVEDGYVARAYSILTKSLSEQEKNNFFVTLNSSLNVIKERNKSEYENFRENIDEIASAYQEDNKSEEELEEIEEKIKEFAEKYIKDVYSENNFLLELAMWKETIDLNPNLANLIERHLHDVILKRQEKKIPYFGNQVRKLLEYIEAEKSVKKSAGPSLEKNVG